ncbi:MAG TPA: RRM3/PIF1 helicase-like protein, partial [bacterium]|nr:RRM3/PIF1 helicase-like protein [bacterium]
PISANSRTKDWAFLSHAWQQTEFENILLKTIVRTREKEFIDVLNEIRIARPTSLARDFLNSKTEPFVEDYDGTCLFPRRQQTDGFNIKKLAQIDSAPRIFPTKYEGRKEAIESLKKQAPIPPVLELKIGALVMLRQNDPAYRFINGTTGHVIDIETDRISIELKNKRVIEVEPSEFSLLDADGEVAASAFNFPLCLAYALTIHKAQGTTLDEALIDLRNLWEPGQAYVALSRLSSSDGLKLIGWDESSILADEQVTRFYENIER